MNTFEGRFRPATRRRTVNGMQTTSPEPSARSKVTAVAAADPADAHAHFAAKLAVETDPSDVHADLAAGCDGFVVVDSRSRDAYDEAHVPGAVHLHHADIDATTTASFPPDAVLVVYCWGPGCNAATKGARRLAALGFRVKEMIGGIEYWRREGYPVATSGGPERPA
jgi:rhodanese-related sulfurtransferase